jgi:hypothetical protein
MLTALRILLVLEAAIFLMAACLHTGTPIPLGFATVREPAILPARIVETSCGVFLAFAAWSIFTARTWAWGTALASQIFAICGVVLGIVALSLGRGPRTLSNDIYHRIMSVMLVCGIVLLYLTRRRTA